MATVLVGRPGALVGGEGVDEYTSRMGGDALYPRACGAPDASLTSCKVCGQDLALVLQVMARPGGAVLGWSEQQGADVRPHVSAHAVGRGRS